MQGHQPHILDSSGVTEKNLQEKCKKPIAVDVTSPCILYTIGTEPGSARAGFVRDTNYEEVDLMNDGLLPTGEFAKRAGTTARALRYYDRLALVQPTARTQLGQRLYGPQDLIRLQQVLTLKFLGFSLHEIKRILAAPGYDLAQALETQHGLVEKQIQQTRLVLRAIERARETLAATGVDWDSFVGIIRAVRMEQHKEWWEQFFTEEQMAKLEKESNPELRAKGEAGWAAIYEEAGQLASRGADPLGEAGQALAAKARALIEHFTKGDSEIRAALERMYSDQSKMPLELLMGNQQSRQFLNAAMGAQCDSAADKTTP
jgi:MerR family transcriptional regulator, thiopeptide resistance regulator